MFHARVEHGRRERRWLRHLLRPQHEPPLSRTADTAEVRPFASPGGERRSTHRTIHRTIHLRDCAWPSRDRHHTHVAEKTRDAEVGCANMRRPSQGSSSSPRAGESFVRTAMPPRQHVCTHRSVGTLGVTLQMVASTAGRVHVVSQLHKRM